jgi:hypothetical protein
LGPRSTRPNSEKYVRSHRRPGNDFQIFVAEIGGELTLVARGNEARRDARRSRLIMLAIGGGFDEFGLVDDAIDIAVAPRELEEGFEGPPLGVECIAGALERRGNMVANLQRHVAD